MAQHLSQLDGVDTGVRRVDSTTTFTTFTTFTAFTTFTTFTTFATFTPTGGRTQVGKSPVGVGARGILARFTAFSTMATFSTMARLTAFSSMATFSTGATFSTMASLTAFSTMAVFTAFSTMAAFTARSANVVAGLVGAAILLGRFVFAVIGQGAPGAEQYAGANAYPELGAGLMRHRVLPCCSRLGVALARHPAAGDVL
ncbi:hypothetical protein ACUN9Y_20700 [Halomonas sp. V046]|uniref:hypothetical protein n=1 Tax=Halomonas sp. V046 TaxID=3459611 RepID=UPI004043CFF9